MRVLDGSKRLSIMQTPRLPTHEMPDERERENINFRVEKVDSGQGVAESGGAWPAGGREEKRGREYHRVTRYAVTAVTKKNVKRRREYRYKDIDDVQYIQKDPEIQKESKIE